MVYGRSLSVIITGASSGIGAGAARTFARDGYSVSLSGRNARRLNAVADQCAELAKSQAKVLATQGDVTHDRHIDSLVKGTLAKFGKINCLINNVGAVLEDPTNDVKPIEVFDQTIAINTRSVINLSNHCIPHLIDTKGCIVNVSSDSGSLAQPQLVYYCVSKAAVEHYTRTLALGLAPKGVRVNCICPAAVDTPVLAPIYPDKAAFEQLVAGHPIGRIGNVEEVAELIAFLADNKRAGFITGALVPIDGGATLQNPFAEL